jgi:hypothetical protein
MTRKTRERMWGIGLVTQWRAAPRPDDQVNLTQARGVPLREYVEACACATQARLAASSRRRAARQADRG